MKDSKDSDNDNIDYEQHLSLDNGIRFRYGKMNSTQSAPIFKKIK